MIEREKFLSKERKGFLGDSLVDFHYETKSVEYVLYDILFPEWFVEQLQTLAGNGSGDGYIEYWEDGYFEKKYGKDETHFIKQEDYKHSIKVNTIKGLYDYLYNSYAL